MSYDLILTLQTPLPLRRPSFYSFDSPFAAFLSYRVLSSSPPRCLKSQALPFLLFGVFSTGAPFSCVCTPSRLSLNVGSLPFPAVLRSALLLRVSPRWRSMLIFLPFCPLVSSTVVFCVELVRCPSPQVSLFPSPSVSAYVPLNPLSRPTFRHSRTVTRTAASLSPPMLLFRLSSFFFCDLPGCLRVPECFSFRVGLG